MAKKFTLRVWHLIVLMVILILLAKGGQFERMGLAGRGTGVTFTDYTSSGCKQTNIAYPQYAQLKCELGAPTTDTFDVDEKETYTANLYDASTSYFGCTSYGIGFPLIKIVDSATGLPICSGMWHGVCSGKPLAYGNTYIFSITGAIGESGCKAQISGKRANLYFYTPDAVAGEKVEHTENCLAENWFYEAEKTSLWNKVKSLIKGKDATDQTGKTIAGSSLGSVTMQLGDSFKYLYAYIEKAPLGIQNYNGQLVHCDQNEQRLIGFQRLTGLDGSCWVSPDSSNVVIDGSGKKFCCNSQACVNLGLSPDHVCQDFECIEKGVVTGGCNSPSDCGTIKDYITDANGQAYLIEATCDKARPQSGWLGTCDQSKIKIDCDPSLTYSNNKCCKYQNEKYTLTDCTAPLNDCVATLGENACCLDSQSLYSKHECEPSLKCCGADNDGIGICAESCTPISPNIFGDLFGKITDAIGKAFGVVGNVATVLTWILIILAVIIVLVLLSKAGRRGGGVGGGLGTPVTIANIVNGANPGNWGTKPGWTMPQGVQTYSLGRWLRGKKR